MTCSTCGCAPCQCVPCPPTTLNQARLFDPVVSGGTFTNGVWGSPTINVPQINGGAITGATIDCTTQVCTQPPGTCNATIASTAFVCVAIDDAISPLNAAFCTAVAVCLSGGGTLCDSVSTCINTTPDFITNPATFAASTQATETQRGTVEIATQAEIEGNVCGTVIDACGLIDALGALNVGNQFGFAFQTAVTTALGAIDFCALTAGCGYAPLVSPPLSGIPTAPTAAPGTNTTQIATTAFVGAAITTALGSAISGGNPAFCAAVAACIGGGGSVGNFASFTVTYTSFGGGSVVIGSVVPTANYGIASIVQIGGVLSFRFAITWSSPQPDTHWTWSAKDLGVGTYVASGLPANEDLSVSSRDPGATSGCIGNTPTVNGYTFFEIGSSMLYIDGAHEVTVTFTR